MPILLTILLILVALVCALFLLIKYIEDKKVSQIIDVTTGKPISRDRVIGIIPSLVTMIGEKHLHRSLKHLRDSKRMNFEPYITFLGVSPVLNCPPLSDYAKIFTQYKEYPRLSVMNAFLSQLMGEAFVFQNGVEWKTHRNYINHAFFDINVYVSAFREKSVEAVKLVEADKPFSISSLAQKFTLDVLGKTMFNVDFSFLKGSEYNEYVEAYHYVLKRVNNNAALILKGLYTNLPTEANKLMKKNLDVMDRYALKLVDEAKQRVQENQSSDTMLEVLVGSNEYKETPLSDKALKDDVALMFVAGHETSANALTFAFYALGKWQHVQEKVLAELDEKLKNNSNTVLNRSDINELTYMDCFIHETLRMFPVIGIIIPRIVDKSVDVLGNLKLKKGTFINICPMTSHWNPENYEEPNVFDPDRFLEENKNKKTLAAFMPFGGGPRVCAGKSFAMVEMKFFIATILQQYRVELLDPNYEMSIHGTGTITLPDPEFKVKFVKRQ